MTTQITTTNIQPAALAFIQGPVVSTIQITNSSYTVLDDTAVNTAGGYIKITGVNFVAGMNVVIGSVTATSVSVVSSTVLNVQVPAQSAGTYIVYVIAPDGGVSIVINGLTYSGDPTWVTGSTLTSGQVDSAISIQLSATGDAPITYALQAGSSLPAGLTLTSGGLLSGTVTGITSETTYNFTVEAIDGQAQESPRAFSITIAAGDANFENVTTLLSANNPSSTFVTDASTNNFAVTVNGDTRPNNFGPYTPGYYSAYFDTSGDSLTVPYGSTLALGTSNCTIEFWAYLVSYPQEFNNVVDVREGAGTYSTDAISFGFTNAGAITFYAGSYSPNSPVTETAAALISLNVWNHVALVRSSGTTKIYLNGVERSTTANSWNQTSGTASLLYIANALVSRQVNGYISNLRIVKGVAVYTGSFIPPTSPLAATQSSGTNISVITGTQTALLTCQSNRFIDNSTNNFTITRNGDTLISGFDPFAPLSAYSTYGSGYFDGSGDYLSLAGNTAFTMPGDFTAEAWVYCNGYTNDYAAIFGFSNDSENTGWNILVRTNGRLHFNVAMTFTDATGTLPLNQWTHVALVRSGSGSGNVKLYVNGVADATTLTVTATATSPSTVMLGSYPGITSRAFNGYIMDARIVKGTAVYTSNFTPPTTPLTAITNTSLLTLQNNQPNNNNMFLDSSASNFLITRNGNTTQGSFSPYGGGWSNYFGATGQYLSIPYNSAFNLTGDFTIECWINPGNLPSSTGNAAQSYERVFSFGTYNAANSIGLEINSNDGGNLRRFISWYNGTSYNVSANNAVAPGNWYHIALVRSGTTITFYINGVSTGLTITGASAAVNTSQALYIASLQGFESDASAAYNGYISNFRVVKGTALYTSNFTPSTSPLTAITNTSLLTCQSNRFIDNSTNAFTITRNGDVSVQRFNPFNPVLTTPISYSGYFDGTGDYLTVASNAATTLNADFTTEFWVYRPVSGNNYFFCLGDTITSSGIEVYIGSTGSALIVYSNGANRISSATLPAVGTWSHVAVVRAGTTVILYLNGSSLGTWTSSATFSGTTYIGAEFYNGSVTGVCTGYISNVRLVKGTAVYTAAFTPPTAPLTAVSGTSLLTCQNATFIDNSTNNFTVTALGNSQPIQFNPFGWTSTTGGSAAYSATNYGGSMYFDGTGDYLALPSNSAFAFGTGDFTIEMWAYFASVANFPTLTDSRASTSSTAGFNLGLSSAKVQLYTTSQLLIGATTLTANNWNHIAVTRSGTTLRIFLNGVQDASATNSTNWSDTTLRIGATPDTVNFMTGYIGNLRLVKGQALYTSNFAPPVAPLSFNANAVLQLNGTSAAIYDSSMMVNYETIGNTLSTGSIKKYGNSSIYIAAAAANVFTPASPNLDFGTGDFTIECFVYSVNSGIGLYPTFISSVTGWSSGASGHRFNNTGAANKFTFHLNGAGDPFLTSSGTYSFNTWYYYALTRSGNTWRMFIDGVQQASGSFSGSFNQALGGMRLGYAQWDGTNGYYNGYLDDLRFTKGVARYTSTFTPPTNPVIQF